MTLAASPALPESTYVDEAPAPIVSGEVKKEPTVTLNSAPEKIISGEINITIPFNPLEVETAAPPASWVPDEPKNVHLNSATAVSTGPALNVVIALVLSLMISGVIYTRMKPFMK